MRYTDIGTRIDECIYCGRQVEVGRYEAAICDECIEHVCEKCEKFSYETEDSLCLECKEEMEDENNNN